MELRVSVAYVGYVRPYTLWAFSCAVTPVRKEVDKCPGRNLFTIYFVSKAKGIVNCYVIVNVCLNVTTTGTKLQRAKSD